MNYENFIYLAYDIQSSSEVSSHQVSRTLKALPEAPAPTMQLWKLPFAMHAAIETAAGISFIVRPEKQLPGCTPAAKLILRQYGGLLLASSMVCLIIITNPGFDTATTRLLAAALGSYHAWPCHRALTRIRNETRAKEESMFGGPLVHLLVHMVCLSLFLHVVVMET
ncbi:hypothetical protein EV127DRAFT_433521 [Xylaria flabelliformis]|nr:hypothetical protein EV127DRAFT_433521 [Xylaria flabelliformis]